MIRIRLGIGCTPLLLALGVGVRAASPASAIQYNHDIRPVLSDNCFACHGPDQSKRKGKLRLDVREDAIAKKAIVPGQPEQSELVRRILSTDPDEMMPPPKSQKKLSAEEKTLLRDWVRSGAEYQGHWAFLLPKRPSTPRAEGAIDFLVRQRLEQVGLKPSPGADGRTLIRRLYLDLVGMPPKPEEVSAFEQDAAPDAYERVVECLLASPHYGERMAIGWLDVVRYADTIGYHSDNPRNVWPYRDYVIEAFNRNKPFDVFTREQLAGDLLPNPTQEQKVASAFNRLLLSTEEGGAQPRDYEARMLTDRVRAVGAVWLGQTLGCAQCHDHKFDPITSRDFYSMGAFFADVREPIIGRREDGMLVPDEKQAQELKRLDERLAEAKRELEKPRPEIATAWEAEAKRAHLAEPSWEAVKPDSVQVSSGNKVVIGLDGTINTEHDPANGSDTYRIRIKTRLDGVTAIRVEGLTSDRLPGKGPGRAKDGGFLITELALEDSLGSAIELAGATATWESPGAPALAAVDGNTGLHNGWMVFGLSGVPQSIQIATAEPLDVDPVEGVTLVLRHGNRSNGLLGRFRVSVATDPAVTSAPRTTAPPGDVGRMIVKAESERTAEEQAKIAGYFRSVAPELGGERADFAAAQKAKTDYEASVPHCLVSDAMEKPRTVRLLPRGDWLNESGEIVQPALPGYLVASAKSDGHRLSRLDLANWLVCRDNPLTARVVMNRVWKQFFGMGLSRVLDDFGAQGEPPPNQALLDWLACEFMESGWNIKHMVRLMVESQTYRQVSIASKEAMTRDPYNRELSRQSRWRLEAELVRDNALSIAGLLDTKVGGPSAKPYQPDGYWENLNFPVRTYDASRGGDQYRRGLYTWWQRSYLHPSMAAFDAPTREECAAERSRSNIPQQALVLLNDPTYVEAARVFAGRILNEGGTDATTRIGWAFREALSRAPRPDELEVVFNLLYKQLSERNASAKPSDLLHVGMMPSAANLDQDELAAWTNVARVLLNLHETITRS